MVWLRKRHAGSASGGWVWPEDGAAIDVPDDLALELMERPGGEFTEADPPPMPEPAVNAPPPVAAEQERAEAEVAESPPPRRRKGAAKPPSE